MNDNQKEQFRKESNAFYKKALQLLTESKVPFLLGGAFAVRQYTGIFRDTKDLDVFCKPNDYVHILNFFSEKGYETELTDARWLAKIFNGEYFIDLIFDSSNCLNRVDESWFDHAVKGKLLNIPVAFLAPEYVIWSKLYIQNRDRYDGADINHIILKYGNHINWKLLLNKLDKHWHLLLSQILNFQFIYPSERDIVPEWLVQELLLRAKNQYRHSAAKEKTCRGPLLDQSQYHIDITEWGFKVITTMTI